MAFQDPTLPRILILPQGRSPTARICTLLHPRTTKPNRYFFDPETGIYEFTKIAAPKSVCRSWLIGSCRKFSHAVAEIDLDESPIATNEASKAAHTDNSASRDTKSAARGPISDGFVLRNGEMMVATPIDYLFLLLPCFVKSSSVKTNSRGLFLSAEDLLENLSEDSIHFTDISRHRVFQVGMEERMQTICDTVDAGDNRMYRLNDEKLLAELVLKAKGIVARGLPSSMEERFIRKVIEPPVIVLKREESSLSSKESSQNTSPSSGTIVSGTADSQTDSSNWSAASVATEVTAPDEKDSSVASNELYHLLRLRTAISYMVSSYVPLQLAAVLDTLLASENSPVDFRPLETHLANVAILRAEALAARSLGDYSRKRSMYEEDDAIEIGAEKKRRKEEEEKKKKAGETRGIRDLKKVDTKGMKKMSDFFGKRTSPRKR